MSYGCVCVCVCACASVCACACACVRVCACACMRRNAPPRVQSAWEHGSMGAFPTSLPENKSPFLSSPSLENKAWLFLTNVDLCTHLFATKPCELIRMLARTAMSRVAYMATQYTQCSCVGRITALQTESQTAKEEQFDGCTNITRLTKREFWVARRHPFLCFLPLLLPPAKDCKPPGAVSHKYWHSINSIPIGKARFCETLS
jgi:hypothetical protein